MARIGFTKIFAQPSEQIVKSVSTIDKISWERVPDFLQIMVMKWAIKLTGILLILR